MFTKDLVLEKPDLSNREMEVLKLAAAGKSHKIAARELGLTEQTIKNHWTAINHKFQAFDKSQSIYKACKSGIL